MKNIQKTFVAAALLVAVSVSAQNDLGEEQIRQTRSQYNVAIAQHNVPAIVSFLDEEYQVTTSLGQLSQGRDGEAASWSDLIATRQDVLYVRTPELIEVSSDYPLAAETGSWIGTWSTAAGPVRTGGRYAAMWRQVEGDWKVRSELFVALFCVGAMCP